MPFKFWKKEEAKPAPPPPKKPEGKPAPKAAEKAAPKAAEKAPPEKRAPVDIATEVHRGLVEAGLAMEATRDVFKKRLAEKFGSIEEFEKTMKQDPQVTLTGFVVSWLGFTVPGKFDLDDKKEKLAARGMMKMVQDLNGNWLKDSEKKPAVTCWTCHRGEKEPEHVIPPEKLTEADEMK